VRGPLFGFLVALVIVLVVLAVVYAADIVLRALESARDSIAKALNVTATTEYSAQADQVAAGLAVVVVAAVLFIIALYMIHVKER
jgi:hypothetical protein